MTDDVIDRVFRSVQQPLAAGVQGVTFSDPDGALVINWIAAEHEGSGDVSRYLDALPTDRTVRVVGVTSDRLAGMLDRRGYKFCRVLMPAGDDWIEAFVRRGTA